MTSRRRLAIAVMTAAMFTAACASGGRGSRVIEGGVTVPAAPRLASLPRDATYAWVSPEALFGKLTPEDLERSVVPGVGGLRRDLDVVFGAHGWHLVDDAAAAQYVVAVAVVDRTAAGATPTSTRPARCAVASNGQQVCNGAPRNGRSFDTRLSQPTLPGPWIMRSIRRREDGAETVRVLTLLSFDMASAALSDQTLRLFLGDERAR